MFYPLNNLMSPRIPSPNSTKYSIVYCPKSGMYWVTNSMIVVMMFLQYPKYYYSAMLSKSSAAVPVEYPYYKFNYRYYKNSRNTCL